jgi:hypothetical protein
MAMYFPYGFKEKYPSNTCLVKIWFGKKYFIWKAKALKQTADQVCRDLSRKVRLGCPETDLFYQVCQYIKRGRILSCTFEVILTTDDHAVLVNFERELLAKVFGTPDCLNINPEPYLPSWINLTSNKAPQSIISPPDVGIDAEEGEIKNSVGKKASTAKIAHANTPAQTVVEKMNAIKQLRGAKI